MYGQLRVNLGQNEVGLPKKKTKATKNNIIWSLWTLWWLKHSIWSPTFSCHDWQPKFLSHHNWQLNFFVSLKKFNCHSWQLNFFHLLETIWADWIFLGIFLNFFQSCNQERPSIQWLKKIGRCPKHFGHFPTNFQFLTWTIENFGYLWLPKLVTVFF